MKRILPTLGLIVAVGFGLLPLGAGAEEMTMREDPVPHPVVDPNAVAPDSAYPEYRDFRRGLDEAGLDALDEAYDGRFPAPPIGQPDEPRM